MYPIPATRNLSLLEISEHWSAEIYPPRSRQKLLDDLTKAWWRGELKSARGLPHVKVLRAFCNIYDSQLVFPGSKEPQILGELPDGNYGYLFPISLPNAQSDSWDDTNCKQAFDDVAAIWGLTAFDTIAAIISGFKLTETEFTDWSHAQGYNRPIFRAEGTSDSSMPIGVPPQSPVNNHKKRREKKPEKLASVVATMRQHIRCGCKAIESLDKQFEKELASEHGVSRDTVRKARSQVMSEFVDSK